MMEYRLRFCLAYSAAPSCPSPLECGGRQLVNLFEGKKFAQVPLSTAAAAAFPAHVCAAAEHCSVARNTVYWNWTLIAQFLQQAGEPCPSKMLQSPTLLRLETLPLNHSQQEMMLLLLHPSQVLASCLQNALERHQGTRQGQWHPATCRKHQSSSFQHRKEARHHNHLVVT